MHAASPANKTPKIKVRIELRRQEVCTHMCAPPAL